MEQISLGEIIAIHTIRPSRKAYKSTLAVNALLLLPLIVISFTRVDGDPIAVLVGGVILLALIALFVFLYFHNTRIEFTETTLTRANLFGRTRTWQMSEITTVLRVEALVAFMQSDTLNIFVLDSQGRCVVRPSNQMWSLDEVTALITATGVKETVVAQPITATELRVRYPRAVPWWEAHVFATALIAVGLLTVLIVGFFFLDRAHVFSEIYWATRRLLSQWGLVGL